MYKLESFLSGFGVDHEFCTVGFTSGSVEHMNKTGIDEDTILDTLCHKGGSVVKHERFAIVKDSSYALCSIKPSLSGLGYFVKVYFVGSRKRNGKIRGLDNEAIIYSV